MSWPLPVEDDRTLVVTRLLDAPRALVWRAFSDPFHLSQWWGPKGYTNPVCELDFRPGGRWHHVMRDPAGNEYPVDSEFIDIVPPERIVYRNAAADPATFGDNPPPSFVRTITFEDVDGRTRLTMVARFDTAEHRERVVRRGFRAGTEESFDRLAALLQREGGQ
jgi:uncharacterized protein YndB with AHSA1/START domain